MSCAAPNVQQSSCATENCRYNVFNGHKMLTCRHESFTACPFQTLASHLHKKQPSCNRRAERFGGFGALRHNCTTTSCCKSTLVLTVLAHPSAPHTTDSRSANNVVPLRKTFMRHAWVNYRHEAATWFLSNFDSGCTTVDANDVLMGHPTCATSRYELHFNASDPNVFCAKRRSDLIPTKHHANKEPSNP